MPQRISEGCVCVRARMRAYTLLQHLAGLEHLKI